MRPFIAGLETGRGALWGARLQAVDRCRQDASLGSFVRVESLSSGKIGGSGEPLC